MAFNFSPKIVTDGLVLYLDAANSKSIISGSTTWTDLSRGGNNGTLIGGPTFNSGNGGSIVFDGSNDYVSGSITPLTSNYTVEIFFKLITFNAAQGLNDLISFAAGINQGFLAEIESSTRKIRFLHRFPYGQGPSGDNVFSSGLINLNQIYSITLVRDSQQKIYINGILDSQITSVQSAFDSNLTQLTIGQLLQTNSIRNINGNVYSVKVYNRALSSQEVLQNYNATKRRFGL
jgi:hypothetical protein